MKKKKMLAAGLALGLVLGMSIQAFGAAAIEKIEAYVNHEMTFEFDGEKTALPEGYQVLVYEGRSYVPARFVAEKLGAEVEWNDATKVISITSPKKEDTTTGGAVEKDPYRYKALPQTKEGTEYTLTALSYEREPQTNLGDRLYIRLTNNAGSALQIQQMDVKYYANGKTYALEGADAQDFDTRWYNDLSTEDDVKEGYLRLPKDLKKETKIHVEIPIQVKNNQNPKTDIVEFDIQL